MATLSRAATLQHAFSLGGLHSVFVEHLGWDAPRARVPHESVEAEDFAPELVASMRGFGVYRVATASRPSRELMRQVDSRLAELSPERMEVFQFPEGWIWHWPRRTHAGTATFDAVETAPDILPAFLAQRLSGLEITVSDLHAGITLAGVRARVYGEFDAGPVTARFSRRFRIEHESLAAGITGIPESERFSYAMTLLNRLMFLYFLQKKEFLGGDPSYLENLVAAVKRLQKPDRAPNVYRDALLPLFFDRLDARDQDAVDPEIARILGRVPSVGGGIFGRTPLEEAHADELAVPDTAVESILGFFADFTWHLDTRPTGNQDEINPEVIGYIFEQYINFASSGKRENGAYYTPHDVTAHMVAQTLVPRILDGLPGVADALGLLRDDPDRYLAPAMLHGWDDESGAWRECPADLIAAWQGDPLGWDHLDRAEALPEITLPGETWVETFHRRDRVDVLRERIRAGEITEVNDLITHNLNGELLLTDAIDRLEDGTEIARLFASITRLTVFDPTCGSGAFLFAALEVLENVYDHLVDAARDRSDAAVAGLLARVDAHPGKRSFIRTHIALRNLYGTDLMPDAIETAKLRIFLALAACVDTRDELTPLPDLDFNLKAGNLVVGFQDADDVHRIGADPLTSAQLVALEPQIDEYAAMYAEFVELSESSDPEVETLTTRLRERERELRRTCDAVYAEASGVPEDERAAWTASSRPFHWFCEFPEVMRRGGFDVIVGNPPYVRMTQLPGYEVVGYATSRCPDLFAVCYERSLSLLSPTGRHSFVVMLNLSFSDRFAPLRQVISDRAAAEWWSTFGKWPTQLFAGVRVANTIVVLGPGDRKHSTRHHIFGAADRGHLFQTVESFEFERDGATTPIRGGIAERLLRAVDDRPPVRGPVGGESLFLRPTGQYWFPVLFGAPPVLDAPGAVIEERDHRVIELRLRESESRLLAGAALAGKVSYAWWSAVGDDFDVNADEADLARTLAAQVEATPELLELAAAVRDEGRRHAFVSTNNDGYVNVRWSSARAVTDRFDRALLEAAGLLEHWRALNIWYRQCMRSTRANNNSRLLTGEEADRLLPW